MALPFFYEEFEANGVITLQDSTQHYMLQVLRMREGEEFILTNGKGLKADCTLEQVEKKRCSLNVRHIVRVEKPKRYLHLAISFTKNPARMEWLLEKATELGIEEITPLISARSEKHFLKRERFEKILQSAMLQSQQFYLPLLNEPTRFHSMLSKSSDCKLIAHCLQEEKTHPLQWIQREKSCLILSGPEGDFTSEEVDMALKQGFTSVSLGNTRLRTETAGLLSCAYYQSQQF